MWIPRKPYGFQFIYSLRFHSNSNSLSFVRSSNRIKIQMQRLHPFLTGSRFALCLHQQHPRLHFSLAVLFFRSLSRFHLSLPFTMNYILFAHMQLCYSLSTRQMNGKKTVTIRAKLFNSWWLCAAFLFHCTRGAVCVCFFLFLPRFVARIFPAQILQKTKPIPSSLAKCRLFSRYVSFYSLQQIWSDDSIYLDKWADLILLRKPRDMVILNLRWC